MVDDKHDQVDDVTRALLDGSLMLTTHGLPSVESDEEVFAHKSRHR